MTETTQASVELVNGSKEINEVFEAIHGIIASAKSKESVIETVTKNFDKLKNAFEDYEKVPEELKEKQRAYPTVGFHFGKVISHF